MAEFPDRTTNDMNDAMQLQMTAEELDSFFEKAFPGHRHSDHIFEMLEPGRARLKLIPNDSMLRPGGIISGPTQMALADRAAYAVILAHIGPVAMAVTSNLNMSFLRAAEQKPLLADARLLKLGHRLATVDVRIWQSEESETVAQSTVTYAIPSD